LISARDEGPTRKLRTASLGPWGALHSFDEESVEKQRQKRDADDGQGQLITITTASLDVPTTGQDSRQTVAAVNIEHPIWGNQMPIMSHSPPKAARSSGPKIGAMSLLDPWPGRLWLLRKQADSVPNSSQPISGPWLKCWVK
jgi:hypothetical protein